MFSFRLPNFASILLAAFYLIGGLSTARADEIPERCRMDFSESLWADLSDAPHDLGSHEASLYLRRFSKPGGYDTRFLWAIEAAIGLPDVDPSLLFAGIEGVAASDAPAGDLERIKYGLENWKRDLSSSDVAKRRNECRTPVEIAALRRGAIAAIEGRTAVKSSEPFFELMILRFALQELPAEKREGLMDLLAVHFAEFASGAMGSNVYKSLLAKISLDAVQPFFGEKRKDESALTWAMANPEFGNTYDTKVDPILVASRSFSWAEMEATNTGYGVYYLKPGSISLRELLGKKKKMEGKGLYFWAVGNRFYGRSLKVSVGKGDPLTLVSSASSPDYSAMWAKGTFTGLVMTGANLADEHTPGLLAQYRHYYERQGFQFSNSASAVDLKSFVLGKIKSGELAYLVKEAHAGGDTENVVEISKSGRVLTGVHATSRGTEKIYLLYPDLKSEAAPITNREFGEAARGLKSPLLFLNTSCWSDQKAPNEMAQANTPFLIEFPTTAETTLFFDGLTPGGNPSAIRLILDGIRASKSYPEIRSALASVPDYRNHIGDTFFFPDEEDYREMLAAVRTPLRQTIEIESMPEVSLESLRNAYPTEAKPDAVRSVRPRLPRVK